MDHHYCRFTVCGRLHDNKDLSSNNLLMEFSYLPIIHFKKRFNYVAGFTLLQLQLAADNKVHTCITVHRSTLYII